MNKTLSIIIFCVSILSLEAFACDSPEKLLGEFIQRDLQGERLSYKTSSQIDQLEVDSQFEPAWDTSVVVTGYQIKSININDNEALATILFKDSWITSTEFRKNNVKDEEVKIHLKKINECWKVSPPFIMPRILPEELLRHYIDLVEEDKKAHAEKSIFIEHEKQIFELRHYIEFINRKDK